MKLKNKFMNKNGFSLIEVMVAIAIAGILTMGIASIMKNMTRGNTFINAQQDYAQLNNQIQGMFRTSKCKYVLQTAAANAGQDNTGGAGGWVGVPSLAFNSWGGAVVGLNHILENAQNLNNNPLITQGLAYGRNMMIVHPTNAATPAIQLMNLAADVPAVLTVSTPAAPGNILPPSAGESYRRAWLTMRVFPTVNNGGSGPMSTIQPMDHRFEALVRVADNMMYLCGSSGSEIDAALTQAGSTAVATTCSGGSPVGATRTAYSTNVSPNCAGVRTTQTCDVTGAWLPAGYNYTSCSAPPPTTVVRTTSCSKSCSTVKSDMRVKYNVHEFNLGLDQLLNINPVYYRYNGLGETPYDTEDRVGVIAQQVKKVAPEIVKSQNVKLHSQDSHETQINAVDYQAFTFMLINSVKQLNKQQQEMKQSIEELKKQNKQLKDSSCGLNPKQEICK